MTKKIVTQRKKNIHRIPSSLEEISTSAPAVINHSAYLYSSQARFGKWIGLSARSWLLFGVILLLSLTNSIFITAQNCQICASIAADINPGEGNSFPGNWTKDFTEVGGKLYFDADDGTHGSELWVYDPATMIASMAADILPGAGSSLLSSKFIEVGGKLYFSANEEMYGLELWVYDPATMMASIAADIYPGATFSYPGLWSGGFIEVGGKIYFDADDGTNGRELWVYDPTTMMASIAADISPGANPSNPGLSSEFFIEVGGKLYFDANDGTNGVELWVYDPATMMASIAADINPTGPSNPGFDFFIEVGGKLYFDAVDGTNGRELWVYDPVTMMASIVADINPGADSSEPGTNIFIEVGGKLYFDTDDGTNGRELWVHDPAAMTTNMVADINPTGTSLFINTFIEVDGKLYFAAFDGTEGELWVYDPATMMANIAADINLNPTGSSFPGSSGPSRPGSRSKLFIEVGGKIYFDADDGTNGRELWVYDPGTMMASIAVDIYPGATPSFPGGVSQFFKEVGGKIYFDADDGTNGRELWVAENITDFMPNSVIITDASCTITAPTNNCPKGSTLKYSKDNMTFSAMVPTYNSSTSETIYTRCECDVGTAVSKVNQVTTSPADASFNYSATSYCQDASDPSPTITGTTGGTFSSTAGLSINATTGVIDVSSSTAGTYTVTYTTAGTCTDTKTTSVTINNLDDAAFSYSATSYCVTTSDPSPTITGTTGGTFSSTTGLSINAATGVIDVSASTAGTYTITYENANGCKGTKEVTVNSLPVITGDNTVCVGEMISLSLGAQTAFQDRNTSGSRSKVQGWMSSNDAIATVDGNGKVEGKSAGTVTITYEDANGCEGTYEVTVNALPTLSSTKSNPTTCGASDGKIMLSGLIAGTNYTLNYKKGGNSVTAVGITATTGTYEITGLNAAAYTEITVTDSKTCVSNQTAQTLADPSKPTVTAPSNQTVCVGTMTSGIIFSGAKGVSYQWTNSTPSIGLAASGTGDIAAFTANNETDFPITSTIMVTPKQGDCTGTAQSFTITVNPLPTITGDNKVCVGEMISLSLGVQAIFQDRNVSGSRSKVQGWMSSDDAIATVDGNGKVEGKSAGTVTITYEDANGCEGTYIITVEPLPIITGDNSVCVEKTIELSIGTLVTFQDRNGSSSRSYTPIWTSSDDAIATVSSSGKVTGIKEGTVTITYEDDGCEGTYEVTVNALPTAPTIKRDNLTCTYSYEAANTGDTFDPAIIPNAAPGIDPAEYSVTVTNTNGCSASFMLDPSACPSAFTVDNTGGSEGGNPFMASDPCSCNGDQVLNADGSVATVGTFEEIVTVTGPAGLQVRVAAATGMLNTILPASLTEMPVGSGTYQIEFNHTDRAGYNITRFEFSTDNGVTFNTVTGMDGLTPITVSNVCAYPKVVCSPMIPSSIKPTDAPIVLGLSETSTDVNFMTLTGYPQFTINGNMATVFDPSDPSLLAGNYTITGIYDITAGSGQNGTALNPAIPVDKDGDASNGVCPISAPAKAVDLVTIPTMSEWGLMIFGLLIMNLSVVFLKRREELLSTID